MVRLTISCFSNQHFLRHGLVDKMITHEMSSDEARSISMCLFTSLKIDLTDCVHIYR